MIQECFMLVFLCSLIRSSSAWVTVYTHTSSQSDSETQPSTSLFRQTYWTQYYNAWSSRQVKAEAPQAAEPLPSEEPMIMRPSVSVSKLVPSPPGPCETSLPLKRSAREQNGRLGVLQKPEDRETCCEICRGSNGQCSSWFRRTGANQLCYLNSNI